MHPCEQTVQGPVEERPKASQIAAQGIRVGHELWTRHDIVWSHGVFDFLALRAEDRANSVAQFARPPITVATHLIAQVRESDLVFRVRKAELATGPGVPEA